MPQNMLCNTLQIKKLSFFSPTFFWSVSHAALGGKCRNKINHLPKNILTVGLSEMTLIYHFIHLFVSSTYKTTLFTDAHNHITSD